MRTGFASFVLPLWLCGALAAQESAPGPQEPPRDDIEIEDLLKVQVTSLSKRQQSIEDVPAAIHVVRGEDIRRMGVSSLPEALRGVPGMQVARSRSSAWAVSARGFTDNSANKLLALIDGRSIYSPLHSGIFWDVQDTFLEDIERIEVIRGPGGSLWGSNAVNGIVNVITRSAEQTQGALVTAGGGTEEKAFGGVRYGFQAGEDFFLRVYTKYFARDEAALGSDPDEDAFDGWWMGRAGFRGDLKSGDRDRFLFTGSGYTGQIRERGANPSLTAPAGAEPFDNRADLTGGHLLARWDREVDESSTFTLQWYYDRTRRDAELFDDRLDTVDFDFQHRYRWSDAHDLLWGLGYRMYRVHFEGDFAVQLDRDRRTDDLLSAFLQDEIEILEDLSLTVGSKFEHNDYSGFEYQPTARLTWKAGAVHSVWFAASRAVRTPSLIDVDLAIKALVIPGSPPTVTGFFGDSDFRSETLIAYEAGWRARPAEFLTTDLAVFSNRYDRLRSIAAGAPFLDSDPPPQHLVIPFILENELDARSWGIEAAAVAQAAEDLRFQAGYAYLRLNFDDDAAEGRDPRHTAWVRAGCEPGPGWTVDAMARYVSRLKAFDVDGYVEADLRIAWRPDGESVEIALVGQNLMRDSHAEFQSEASRSELERGAYLSVLWGF